MTENTDNSTKTREFHEFQMEDFKQTAELYKGLDKQITSSVYRTYILFLFMLAAMSFAGLSSRPHHILFAVSLPVIGIYTSLWMINRIRAGHKEKSRLFSRLAQIRENFGPTGEFLEEVHFGSMEAYSRIVVFMAFLSVWIAFLLSFIHALWSGGPAFSYLVVPPGIMFAIFAPIVIFIIVRVLYHIKLKPEFPHLNKK